MPIAIQGSCQSLNSAKNAIIEARLAHFATQDLAQFAKHALGTFTALGASIRETSLHGSIAMLGKLAGAWLGEKVAGPKKGARGALLGYGAAALARRSVPALAAVTLGGWAFRKWRDKRRAPSYPPEANPS